MGLKFAKPVLCLKQMLVAEFSCTFREIRQCLHSVSEVSKFSGVLVVDGLNKNVLLNIEETTNVFG